MDDCISTDLQKKKFHFNPALPSFLNFLHLSLLFIICYVFLYHSVNTEDIKENMKVTLQSQTEEFTAFTCNLESLGERL